MFKYVIFLISFCMASSLIDKPQEAILSETKLISDSTSILPLIGQTASKINYIGTTRDIKVDWILTDKFLNPSIAVEFYPIWLTYFKNKSYSEITKMSLPQKQLMDLSVNVCNNNKGGTNYIFTSGITYPIYDYSDIKYNRDTITQIENIIPNSYLDVMTEIAILSVTEGENSSNVIALKKKQEQILSDIKIKQQSIVENYKSNYWNSFKIIGGYFHTIEYGLNREYKPSFKTNNHNIFLITYFPIGKIGQGGILHQYNITDAILELGANIRFGTNPERTIFTEYLVNNNFREQKIAVGGTFTIDNKYKLSIGFQFLIEEKELVKIKPTYKVNM